MCLFQIVEERISLGCLFVDIGLTSFRIGFELRDDTFLAFEPALVVVKIIFTRFFSPFCRHDLTLQLLNSFVRSSVADCLI